MGHTCGPIRRRIRLLPYLVLLRAGFAVPPSVATGAVRSYRTISPLPPPCGGLAVYFLLHFPWAHAPQALPGAVPYGARTFLHTCVQRLSGRLGRGWWAVSRKESSVRAQFARIASVSCHEPRL